MEQNTQQKHNNIHNTRKLVNNTTKRKNRRRKKKNAQKQKNIRNLKKSFSKQNNKLNNKLTCTMSSWAETFSKIVSWQSKHEIAYWKAKATALEHENRILHDIIRKNQLRNDNSESSSESSSDNETEENGSVDEGQESDECEVSQEYIDFLIANFKYREDARREREKFRGGSNEDEVSHKLEDLPVKDEMDKINEAKVLYGSNGKSIIAQEMALDSHFFEIKDSLKPVYWPNTPFNLNIANDS